MGAIWDADSRATRLCEGLHKLGVPKMDPKDHDLCFRDLQKGASDFGTLPRIASGSFLKAPLPLFGAPVAR